MNSKPKLNLSQSEYIRNLIIGFKIKIPEVKSNFFNLDILKMNKQLQLKLNI